MKSSCIYFRQGEHITLINSIQKMLTLLFCELSPYSDSDELQTGKKVYGTP